MKDRTLLMIPGPIEFEPAVLAALGGPTTAHTAPGFIDVFGQALERMREICMAPSSQPFIISGSGTLAMEIAAANLVEPGDNVLVVSTGYFGNRYEEILRRYGAAVTNIRAAAGDIIDPDKVEIILKGGTFKLMTFTHVDTSTAVLVDPKVMAKLGKKYGVLTVLDGVCSVGGEEIQQEKWGIDVVLTASQKAIGVPPGLALLTVSPKAMSVWRRRNTPVGNYYADWKNWLPIMEAYEARKPSYFATPPVNHICALNVSLGQILAEGMEARFARHRKISTACKSAVAGLGLKQVPSDQGHSASTMTAPYYPEGVKGSELLARIKDAGVVLAGGLHPDIKASYFRIGHMGAIAPADILAVVGAIETGLRACGYKFKLGVGLTAAQRVLAGK